jgi:aminopeptidase-like protein
MSIPRLLNSLPMDSIGKEMHAFMAELYPICRSITGDGLRETLNGISRRIPLELTEIPSGTQVFDWTVPREWNIRDAYVKDEQGRRVIDFKQSNLHVLNYSVPIKASMTLQELKPRLYALPEHPDWIPYRTSYYRENWGFCVTQRQLDGMKDGIYEVCIDSTLNDGSLTYGEYCIKGREEAEFLLSCHACHPSLCNDNLSGIALTTFLAEHLSRQELRYSYRFLFVPGTIGSIAWLSRNEERTRRIKHGLVVACVGDNGSFTYKKSRQSNAEIDRAVAHVLSHNTKSFKVMDFSPYGYDERQYCSPGFNLAVGSLTRSPNQCYPQYHTSADNLDFVHPEHLAESFGIYLKVIEVIENNRTYVNLNPKCEPQLGKRGLYRLEGGKVDSPLNELAVLWVLNLSDGSASLLDIAERSGMDFRQVQNASSALAKHDLLLEISPRASK